MPYRSSPNSIYFYPEHTIFYLFLVDKICRTFRGNSVIWPEMLPTVKTNFRVLNRVWGRGGEVTEKDLWSIDTADYGDGCEGYLKQGSKSSRGDP